MHAYETNTREDGGEHEFALLALQRAADYTGKLQNLQEEMPEDALNICKRLEAEYLVLRMALVSLRVEKKKTVN